MRTGFLDAKPTARTVTRSPTVAVERSKVGTTDAGAPAARAARSANVAHMHANSRATLSL